MDSLPQPDSVIIAVGRTVVDGAEYPLECNLTAHVYDPLTRPDEIRVLMLHSRKNALQTTQGIMPCCSLKNVILGKYPYLAVSYAWGSLGSYGPLPLSGNKYINITDSLYKLLCRLSPDDGVLPIWADQLCINQRDKLERASQVKMMSQIYARAAGMSVWLGEGNVTTRFAVDLMKRLDLPGLGLREVTRFRAEKSRKELESLLQTNCIELGGDEPGWAAIDHLSANTWFTRLWTFQEAVVPRDLDFLYGPYDFSLTSLFRALTLAQELGSISSTAYNNIFSTVVHRIKHHGGGTDLMDVLRDTSNGSWNCTDPRDRVYGLIALQRQRNAYDIPVDYDRPIRMVHEDTANAITLSKNSLDILYRPRRNPIPNFPSWLPSWQADYFSEAINDDPPQTDFDCSSGRKHVFEAVVPGHLKVRGKLVANISEVLPHRFSDHQFGRDYETLKAWMGGDTLITALQASRSTFLMAHGTSSAERDLAEQDAYLNWLLIVTLSRGYHRARKPEEFATELGQEERDLASLLVSSDPFGVFMMCKCGHRKIVVLDRSPFTIALSPESSHVGDVVCVLDGANVPIVLRKADYGFEFVGDCYVHGIMYGEAVTWPQDEGDSFVLI